VMNSGMRQQIRSQAACQLCGSLHWVDREAESCLLRMSAGTLIRTCAVCGLSVRDPLPAAQKLLAAYGADYYHDFQMVGREAPQRLISALPLLEGTTGPGRLLEIGCGLGAFLLRAEEHGWDAHGVDVSPWAAAQARMVSRAPIHIAQAEALPYSTGVFDAVVSHHVFEHLTDPIGALRESHRVCRTGGRLLLILPNELRHLFVRWAIRAQCGLPAGNSPLASLRRWMTYQTAEAPRDSDHLFFFHPESLRRAVDAAGWHTLWLKTFRTRQDTISRYPLGGFLKAGLYALEAWLGRGP
jgi:SAM-dependent methyltransferase